MTNESCQTTIENLAKSTIVKVTNKLSQSDKYVVQLLILSPAMVVRKYGLDKVLEPLIKDLRTLEVQGLTVQCCDGVIRTFDVGISFIAADNLAAHSISGLLESFSAVKSCRFCHISKGELQHVNHEEQVQKQCAISHNVQVNLVMQDQSFSKAYGVKQKSALCDL